MHISLLATTYNRETVVLERFFSSLTNQSYKNFSLLLGDQNQPGILDPLLAKYETCFSCKRVFLPRCSLSEARNKLLPLSSGSYVALADDDCHYAPNSFAMLARYVGEYPKAAALVGQGFSCAKASRASEFKTAEPLSRYEVFRATPSWCIFVRHDIFFKLGKFDERMGIGAPTPWQSGEETDLLLRMFDAGEKIYRAPAIHVFHDAMPATSGSLSKIESYGMGRMYLLHKHRFPLWFKLLNIAYPLCAILFELPKLGLGAAKNRIAMFKGRLKGFAAIAGLVDG